jgi:hypothetical protein
MLDTFSKKIVFNLLIDQETFGVIAHCTSLSVANALSCGIPNSSVMSIKFPPGFDKLKGIGLDFIQDENYILIQSTAIAHIASECNVARASPNIPLGKMYDLIPMENVTAAWLEKKKLATERNIGLWLLEQKIERYLARAKFFLGDEILVPFLASEITKCDFDNNVYSDVIIEWAEIADVAPAEAFHILSNKISSTNIIVSRLHAIWFKYVNKINSLNDEQSILYLVRNNLEVELRGAVS